MWGGYVAMETVNCVFICFMSGVENPVIDEFLDKLRCDTRENLHADAHEPPDNINMIW